MKAAASKRIAMAERITTTIAVDRDLFLRFKSQCVMKESTVSGEVERMMKQWGDKITL